MREYKLTIILPTYNEKENVLPILGLVREALRGDLLKYEVLFVDDSNDGTDEIIREQVSQADNIRLLHRENSQRTGLATAFVDGFKKAQGDYICCMDSDLQHSPYDIPIMVAKLEADKGDIVVGARYLPGGSAEGLGGKYRIFISHLCRFFSWAVLSETRKTADPGSGFFIVKKPIVEKLSFDGLEGFKILVDILARVPQARVSDVPIVFHKRKNNYSKATLEQGIRFFRQAATLRLKKKQFK